MKQQIPKEVSDYMKAMSLKGLAARRKNHGGKEGYAKFLRECGKLGGRKKAENLSTSKRPAV